MKKTILLLFFAVFFVSSIYGQRLADIGIAVGADTYLGDVGNEHLFPISNTNLGIAVTLRNFLGTGKSYLINRPLSLEARISWNRIGYEETDPIGSKSGEELRNYGRGLGFRNDVFGASAHITYTFYQNTNTELYRQRMCFFVLAGVGVFYGQPKADLFKGSVDIKNRYYFWSDGTVRDAAQSSGQGNIIPRDGVYETNLRDWMTEGQGGSGTETNQAKPYSYTNVGFPLGFGVRKGLSREITISLEVDYYYFLTDYLDDVSNRYATYTEIQANFPNDPAKQELAKYISDPTGHGTDGTIGPGTSPRGNPKKNDAFTFVSIELSYKIALKKKAFCNQ